MIKLILLALCLAAPAVLGSSGTKGGSIHPEPYAPIKGAPIKSAVISHERQSPAVKGKLIQQVAAAAAVPAPLPVVHAAPAPVVHAPLARLIQAPVRHIEQAPISVENRDWQIKQEQLLQQQRDQLESIVREQRLYNQEQQRLAESQRSVEVPLQAPILAAPAPAGIKGQPAPTKTIEYVRPARIEQATKTSQVKVEDSKTSPIKQEEWSQQQEKVEQLEQQRFEQLDQQQTEQQQPLTQVRDETPEAEPYSFSYSLDNSARSESGDSRGVVRGFYRLAGPDGTSRLVEYVADHLGFRASVKTNEFGTEPRSPANVVMDSSQPLLEDLVRAGATYEQRTEEHQYPVKCASPVRPLEAPRVKGIEVPVVHAPVVPVVAPVRVDDRRFEATNQQQLETDDRVQLIRSEPENSPRAAKSLELAQAPGSPLNRNFVSATAHKPAVSSPVSHRVALGSQPSQASQDAVPSEVRKEVDAKQRAPVAGLSYASSESDSGPSNSGFDHPADE